jgi:hypothetical protein
MNKNGETEIIVLAINIRKCRYKKARVRNRTVSFILQRCIFFSKESFMFNCVLNQVMRDYR